MWINLSIIVLTIFGFLVQELNLFLFMRLFLVNVSVVLQLLVKNFHFFC